MADPDALTDLSELDKTTPAPASDPNSQQEQELRRRHLEHDAMKAAKRAENRENRDEVGNDEFKNIGPV